MCDVCRFYEDTVETVNLVVCCVCGSVFSDVCLRYCVY